MSAVQAAIPCSPGRLLRVSAAFAAGLLLYGSTTATAQVKNADAANGAVYLLAATPDATRGEGYESLLYRVEEKKLVQVRQLSTTGEAAHVVISTAQALWVLGSSEGKVHVHAVSRTAPLAEMSGELNDAQGMVGDGGVVVTDPGSAQESLLFPLMYNVANNATFHAKLDAYSGGEKGSFTEDVPWSRYSQTLTTPDPAGGLSPQPPPVRFSDGHAELMFFGRPTAELNITAPSVALQGSGPKSGKYFLIANTEQVIAVPTLAPAELASIKPEAGQSVYQYSRRKGRWQVLTLDGSASTKRLFGNWLVLSVGRLNTGKASPGGNPSESAEHLRLGASERGRESVEDFYGAPDAVNYIYHPGVLELLDTESGRRFSLTTGRQDSEVLALDGDRVIYRVDTSVFDARLKADGKVGEATLLVQDPNANQIHWAILPQ